MRPKTIGLIAHTGKPGVAELCQHVFAAFRKAGVRVLVEKATARVAAMEEGHDYDALAQDAELLVVLGGDGTILNVVGHLEKTIKPIFGINIGSLGFLTCANSSSVDQAVACIVAGEMAFSERALLEVTMARGAKTLLHTIGLNDAVLSRGELSRLIRLKTSINGEVVTEFNADGLIIATPTGSTAYSLSAGGPIMSPNSGVFVITPICPHVLTNRSVIVDDQSTIAVEVGEREYPVYLTVDGRDPQRVEPGSTVAIRKASQTLPLAILPGTSFFGVVRQKLKWSGSNI